MLWYSRKKYLMVIHECHVLELRITMNVSDHRSFLALLEQLREWPEILSLKLSGLARCCLRPGLKGGVEP